MPQSKTKIPEILKKSEPDVLKEWMQEQLGGATRQRLLIKDEELRQQCKEFLNLLTQALLADPTADIDAAQWGQVREFLVTLSRSRSLQGFSPRETASFVFSLKRPLFSRLRKEIK